MEKLNPPGPTKRRRTRRSLTNGNFKIRTEIIKKVISLKSNKREIVDKKRIAFILRKIKKESIKRKIDPTITKKIWKNMIWSYIDFEKKIFKKK